MPSDQPKNDEDLQQFEDSHRDVLELLGRALATDNSLGNSLNKNVQSTRADLEANDTDTPNETKTNNEFLTGHLPESIGRFKIQKLVGRGGFGLVFQATDPRLKREIALKIPRPEAVMTEETRARFLREAETAASLNHANIIPVFEAGNHGLIFYMASAFCDGPTLSQWYEEQVALSPQRAAEMMLSICDAVQHAHSRGIIHRDLKPDNILVESRDENDANIELPKLLITDFGLAKSTLDNPDLSRDGSLIGTPAYMAPEQVESERGNIGFEADIYAIGATLYFLLCGRPPFPGKTLVETARMVQQEMPGKPSTINADVPRDLDAICLKCLEKEPTKRYQSASELNADLVRFLNGQPVLARQPTLVDRLTMWCRRRPAVAALSGALLIVMALSSFALAILLVRSNQLKTLADDNAAIAAEERNRVRNALDSMTSGIATGWLSTQQELTPIQEEFIRETIGYYQEFVDQEIDTNEDRFWVAKAEARLSTLLFRLGKTDEASKAINRAIDHLEKLPEQWNESQVSFQLAESLLTKEEFLEQIGKTEESLEVARRAEKIARKLVDANPHDTKAKQTFAKILGNIALRLQKMRIFEQALTFQKESTRIKEELLNNEPDNQISKRQLGLNYMNLGNLFAQMRRMNDSQDYLEKSLEIRKELVEYDPTSFVYRHDLAWTLDNLGGLCHRLGKLRDAAGHYDQAILLRQKLADDYPLEEKYLRNLMFSLFNRSVIAKSQDDLDVCQAMTIDTIRIAENGITEFPQISVYRIMNANGKLQLAKLLAEQGQPEQALEDLTSTKEQLMRLIDDKIEAIMAGRILEDLVGFTATTLSQLGRHDEAIENWTTAIEMTNDENRPVLELCRATSKVKNGEVESAIKELNQIIAGMDDKSPTGNASIVYYNAACVFALLSTQAKDDSSARSHALKSIEMLRKSIDCGFTQFGYLKKDPELDGIRKYKEFQQLVENLQSPG